MFFFLSDQCRECVMSEYSLLFVFGEGPFRNPIFQMSSFLYGGFKGGIFYIFIALSIFPLGPLEMLVKVSNTKNSRNLVLQNHFPLCVTLGIK